MRAAVILVAAAFVGAVTYFALRSDPERPAPAEQARGDTPRRPSSGRANGGVLEAVDPDTRTPDGTESTGSTDPDAAVPAPVPTPKESDWIAALREADNDKVFEATIKLAEAGDPAAIDPLIDVLKDHTDFYCRLGAATALGQLSSWRAVDALADSLVDADQLVRAASSEALRQITGHEIKGYSPTGAEDQLTSGQRLWREWLAEHRPDR